MHDDVARWKNAQHQPSTYGMDGDALAALTKCLMAHADRKCRLLLRMALYDDGSPTLWWELKEGTETLGKGNVVWTCPPRPPEDCED